MNGLDATDARTTRAARRWAWTLVAARPASFLAAQAGIAGLLALGGAAEPWWAAAGWWPLAATLANVAGFVQLRARARAEGVPVRRLALGDGFARRDAAGFAAALPLLAAAALAVPWAWGHAVWGDPGVGFGVLASPLPAWAALLALLAYPLSMVAVDLPTYAYARVRVGGGALAALAVGAALGLQHVALPFLPAWTFVEWRALMWVPYGVFVVGLLAWRPRWLPWLAVVHGLVHAVAAVLVLRASI
jgi:hypothetical protein